MPFVAMCTQAVVSVTLCCQERLMDPPAQDRQEPPVSSADRKSGVITLEPVEARMPVDQSQGGAASQTSTAQPILSSSQPEAAPTISQVDEIGNGVAKVKYTDGSVYEGDWALNKREGNGKMTWRNGDVYQGEWKGDLQNGRGLMMYWDGSRYNGEWRTGQRNGKGEMTWLDGERYGGTHYQGDWVADKREGKGLLRDRYEGTYEGEWRGDRAEGVGKATWRNGNWYQGGIFDGKPEGRGTYFHAATGRALPGNFRAGKKITPSCSVM